jgi:hypothetical protein
MYWIYGNKDDDDETAQTMFDKKGIRIKIKKYAYHANSHAFLLVTVSTF